MIDVKLKEKATLLAEKICSARIRNLEKSGIFFSTNYSINHPFTNITPSEFSKFLGLIEKSLKHGIKFDAKLIKVLTDQSEDSSDNFSKALQGRAQEESSLIEELYDQISEISEEF